jgi:hypothetical protein
MATASLLDIVICYGYIIVQYHSLIPVEWRVLWKEASSTAVHPNAEIECAKWRTILDGLQYVVYAGTRTRWQNVLETFIVAMLHGDRQHGSPCSTQCPVKAGLRAVERTTSVTGNRWMTAVCLQYSFRVTRNSVITTWLFFSIYHGLCLLIKWIRALREWDGGVPRMKRRPAVPILIF